MGSDLTYQGAIDLAETFGLAKVNPGLPRYIAASAYRHEQAGDLWAAARLYADAARSAPNLAERHHLTRQAAQISQALRG